MNSYPRKTFLSRLIFQSFVKMLASEDIGWGSAAHARQEQSCTSVQDAECTLTAHRHARRRCGRSTSTCAGWLLQILLILGSHMLQARQQQIQHCLREEQAVGEAVNCRFAS